VPRSPSTCAGTSQFLRVRRSIVVATPMIRNLEPSGHGECEIHPPSEDELTTGRTNRAQIRKVDQNLVGRG